MVPVLLLLPLLALGGVGEGLELEEDNTLDVEVVEDLGREDEEEVWWEEEEAEEVEGGGWEEDDEEEGGTEEEEGNDDEEGVELEEEGGGGGGEADVVSSVEEEGKGALELMPDELGKVGEEGVDESSAAEETGPEGSLDEDPAATLWVFPEEVGPVPLAEEVVSEPVIMSWRRSDCTVDEWSKITTAINTQ